MSPPPSYESLLSDRTRKLVAALVAGSTADQATLSARLSVSTETIDAWVRECYPRPAAAPPAADRPTDRLPAYEALAWEMTQRLHLMAKCNSFVRAYDLLFDLILELRGGPPAKRPVLKQPQPPRPLLEQKKRRPF